MHTRKIRTRVQRLRSSMREGRGNAVLRHDLSKEHKWERKILINKQGGLCAICGCQMTLGDPEADTYVTIDHIVPTSKGGPDVITNKQAVCRCCNSKKGDS